jgi:hypothetical protein
MVAPVDIGFINYFIPIFAFLFVFVLVYAVLVKMNLLGGNQPVALFLAFLMAIYFIIQVQLVDFVTFTSSWMAVFAVLMFFIFMMLAFLPGKEPLKFLENQYVSWAIVGLLIIFFVISSSYIFSWAINWDYFGGGNIVDNEWFGFALLAVTGLIVSFVITWGATKSG